MGRKIGRGQVIVGMQKLADDLGLSRQQVRTAIKKLKLTNEITTEPTNKYTVITITAWDKYQEEQPSKNQPKTNNKPHLNNINKDNNLKNKETTGSSELPPQEPAAIHLKLSDNSFYSLSLGEAERLKELYPDKNVDLELKKMAFWLEVNPRRRKNKRGIMRFVNGWLAADEGSGQALQEVSHEYDDLEELTRMRAMKNEEAKG